MLEVAYHLQPHMPERLEVLELRRASSSDAEAVAILTSSA